MKIIDKNGKIKVTTGSGGGGSGTVTSVGLSLPTDIFDVGGSPVIGAGTLTATLDSQSQNTFFAAPSGTAGTPFFRSIYPNDLPNNIPATKVSISDAGNYYNSTEVESALQEVFINTTGGLYVEKNEVFVAQQRRINLNEGTGIALSVVNDPSNGEIDITVTYTGSSSVGTVTNVGLSLPTGVFNVLSSPITSSGNITGTFINQSQNTFFGAPTGGSGQPQFRPIYTNDLPTNIPATKIANGLINDTEFGYLDNVTGSIQGQFDLRTPYRHQLDPLYGYHTGTLRSSVVTVVDSGNFYNSTDVENALQEVFTYTTGGIYVEKNEVFVIQRPRISFIEGAGIGLTVADHAAQNEVDITITYTGTAGAAGSGIVASTNDFRLSLTSGTSITTTDVTAATIIYMTQYKGNDIGLYSSSTWTLRQAVQVQITVTGTATNTNYDLFAYWDGANIQLEYTANWSSDTVRSTNLTRQNGVLVKGTDSTRKYLGTFRTVAANQVDDNTSRRFLWNFYNRKSRYLKAFDTTDSWTYSTTTWRPTNNSTTVGTARVEFIVGQAEDIIQSRSYILVTTSALAVNVSNGVGIDSTTVNSAIVFGGAANPGAVVCLLAIYSGNPSIGYHYIQNLEIGNASSGTQTWYGDNGVGSVQSGLTAEIMS